MSSGSIYDVRGCRFDESNPYKFAPLETLFLNGVRIEGALRKMSHRKLRILFLPCWYPSEDNPIAGIFIREHAKAVSIYHDVTVLYAYPSNKTRRHYEISDEIEEEMRTIRIKYKPSSIPKIDYLFQLWLIFLYFYKLVRKGRKPDIIHAHGYLLGLPAIILRKFYGMPVIITEHWDGFPRHMLNFLARIRARFAMNRAQTILPVSKSLEESIKSYGIRNKFEVVPNTVNTKMFYTPFEKEKEKRNQKTILFVGRLVPMKGVFYLLKALAKLKQKRQDFLLDIIGNGPSRKKYKELAKQLGLNVSVRFCGVKSKVEVAEFMRRSDFFVLPSLGETFGVVYIEAMASGLPIIATNVGGIPEIVNKDTGILVSPKNIDALAKAIDCMLDHYQDYSPVKISKYAEERFSYKAVGKLLNSIYENITG